jgi:serine/threonine protein kinase
VSLERRLKRLGRLGPAETLGIISQIVRALSRAHEAGIVHRDLKPENIFLVQNDEEHLAKVLDFGIAKGTHPLSLGLTRPGRILGTPYYMSPEQFRGSEIDQRSDLWSLSVIACECLTGRRPFEANDFGELALLLLNGARRPLPSELGPVPVGFDAWFLRATHAELARRFQSARELGHSLAGVCGVSPQRAGEESAPKGLLPTETDGVSSGPLRWQGSAATGQTGWRPLVVRMVAASASAVLIAVLVVVFQLRQRSTSATSADAAHAAQPATQALPLAAARPPMPAHPPATDAPKAPPVAPLPATPAPEPGYVPVRQVTAREATSEEITPVDIPPARTRSQSGRSHPIGKSAKPARRAATSAAPGASPESDPDVDINGRRIRMTLDPTP